MIVIPPVPLTIPDDIVSTNVPQGIVPQDDPADEMCYQMFAPISNALTVSGSGITVEIKPTARWNALMLFNVGADTLTATILNGPTYSVTQTLAYADPLTPDLLNAPSVYLETPDVDPATHPNATLRIVLSATGRATYCEALSVGWRRVVGQTCYGTEISIVDYSRKDRDAFGNVTLIERGYSDRVNFKFALDTDTIGEVRELLAGRRAKPTGYLGVAGDLATYVFGLFQDFTIPIEAFSVSLANITVDSVVRTGIVDTSLATTLSAAFVDPEVDCIEETLGSFATLILDDDGELGAQTVRVVVPLGRAPVDGEALEWTVEWSEPTANDGTTTVQQICGKWFAVWDWPTGTVSAMVPSAASIQFSYTTLAPVVTLSNAVTLRIASPSEAPCTEETVSAYWYNATTEQYDLTEVYGAVGAVDVRALATVFDEAYYLTENPDVAAAIAAGTYASAYAHYWGPGDIENRRPNAWFDPAYYKAENPDVVAEIPEFFYNALQHYQMFGYGEGRYPCTLAEMQAAPDVPLGVFYWIAKSGAGACSSGRCLTEWEVSYTGARPPHVTVIGDTVTVTADLLPGASVSAVVDPGVLTLTPTLICPASADDEPAPEPLVLSPIALTLVKLVAGFVDDDGEYSLPTQEYLLGVTEPELVAGVDGLLADDTVVWSSAWRDF
ncbi:hypothetical protein [Thiocystis violascens]|uniref:Uncharacterized protein n=1 Tax=Thiocystis violascens (strain ATCC 17096 / DSM 198 / 6111) TaxID=765911 RepID=I3YEJ2_THIV6|nr:hypothetical protein [Thiocystis violascens]AFL75410.1 hypothetical protein Thivi_3544 [Thiocystis violascens DSM 198]